VNSSQNSQRLLATTRDYNNTKLQFNSFQIQPKKTLHTNLVANPNSQILSSDGTEIKNCGKWVPVFLAYIQLGLKFLGAWIKSTYEKIFPTPKTVENFVQTQSPLSFLL
jgi:hypothetical protein